MKILQQEILLSDIFTIWRRRQDVTCKSCWGVFVYSQSTLVSAQITKSSWISSFQIHILIRVFYMYGSSFSSWSIWSHLGIFLQFCDTEMSPMSTWARSDFIQSLYSGPGRERSGESAEQVWKQLYSGLTLKWNCIQVFFWVKTQLDSLCFQVSNKVKSGLRSNLAAVNSRSGFFVLVFVPLFAFCAEQITSVLFMFPAFVEFGYSKEKSGLSA